MPTGYSWPAPDTSVAYQDLVSGFEWNIPDSFNIGGIVEKADPSHREAMALIHVDGDDAVHRFTYAELEDAAARLAAHFVDLGLEAGDRIALCFPQSPELLVAHLAAYRIGCIAVPLSVILGDEAVRHGLTDSGANVLIADAAVYAGIESVASDLTLDSELVVDLSGENYAGPGRHLGGFTAHVTGDDRADVVEMNPADDAIIVYTSGTSGDPKGVVQAHQYLLGALPGYQLWFHLFDGHHRKRVWTPAEWAWAGALFDVVFPTLQLGGTVLSRVRRSGFDPARALLLLEERSVSRAFMPPTAVWQLRDQCDPSAYDLTSFEVMMCGGEQLSAPLFEWAERELDVVVNESYGQTEANALVGNCQAVFEAKPNSMGKPYPGHACRVVDGNGEAVDPGEVGEIVLDLPDPVVFDRYWNDEESTRECFEDGTYLTGDLATVDDDGYLRFTSRADELIITAGYRVSPAEVEAALCTDPLVAEAAVGGVPDEERGQRIKAYVFVESGRGDALSTEQLRQQVRDRLGAYKTPGEIVIREEVPETRTGKLDRSALFPRES